MASGIKKATVGVLAAAAISVAAYEGLYTSPYLDIVGVRTVCYGQTAGDGVDLHRSYTPTECRKMLASSLVLYDKQITACLHHEIPDSMHIAFISASYNIGVFAFCHSSMARKVNDGDLRGACDALLMWDRAGGREIRGLHNRRVSERAICLKDLGG